MAGPIAGAGTSAARTDAAASGARGGNRAAPVTGLASMAAGTLGMVWAARAVSYGITLAALFVIANGSALMQARPAEAVLAGAGLLIMAIAGGSLVVVRGWAADRFRLQHAFLITAACELDVLFCAAWGCRAPRAA